MIYFGFRADFFYFLFFFFLFLTINTLHLLNLAVLVKSVSIPSSSAGYWPHPRSYGAVPANTPLTFEETKLSIQTQTYHSNHPAWFLPDKVSRCASTDWQLDGNSSLQTDKQPKSCMWETASSYNPTDITTLGKQVWQFWYNNALAVSPGFILQRPGGLLPPKQVVLPLLPL